MANETPSRPPPFMANAILNFHFDFPHPFLMFYCETKDFLKSSYTNREINKSNAFSLVFCSLSLEGTKRAKVTQLDYQHLWDLEKLFVLHVLLFCIFSGGPIGVIFAKIICEIFALLKPLWL